MARPRSSRPCVDIRLWVDSTLGYVGLAQGVRHMMFPLEENVKLSNLSLVLGLLLVGGRRRAQRRVRLCADF